MTLSAVDKVEARSSVELDNSCNCNECCPRICGCWPRRIRKVHSVEKHPSQTIEITATSVKVHAASEPALTASGAWEIEIDTRKADSDPVVQSIIQAHGGK